MEYTLVTPREEQWGLNDQDEAWFDPGGGRQARERPRQYQGAHHRDPYWQEQDGPPWNQGRARDPRPMKLDFPRFGPASYDDPMELLTKLKQTHTIAAYKSQFESTSNRVRDLSDMHKLSCFMSGMKDEIRLAVKMQGPRNLGEAYALAKIQEEYLTTVKRSTRPTYEPSRGSWVQSQAQQGAARVENKSGDSKQFSARPLCQVQRLTPMQMSKRRKKGLCYNCDERWSLDHRCKNRKLYLMEEVEDEEAELIEIEEEEVKAELEDEKAEITLCALLGSTSPSTMRVIAILNGQKTVVLLDTGSTHNFMDETLAKTLKLPIDVERNFGVRVANGQVIRTFGWDFKNLVMGFMHEGKQVWLQGLKEKPNLIQGSKDFKGKATMKGLLLQIMPCELASIQEEICAPIRELVEEFPQMGVGRMCVDYRGLNKEMVKDKFPIPMVDELLDKLQGAVVFSKLDLRSGYHQIKMREEDIEKTAFKTHEGHYDKGLEEHIAHLKTILQILVLHQLYAKMSKCVFATSEVEYLGHIISGEVVKTNPKKIAAMVDWPIPKSLKALRGFLKLTGYYRKFIKGYGQIASPFTSLLNKDAFLWSDNAEKAFEELKAAVSQPPVLALPDFSKTFVIECDASGFGMGAVLMQDGRPLAYYSQALKGKNLFLSTYEKELLALVLSVKKWRPYLFATIFTIKTDQQRKENKVADALSRKEDTNLKTEVEKETAYLQAQTRGHLCAISFPSPTWSDDLRASYEEDEELKSLVSRLQASGEGEGHYTLNQGLLLYKDRFYIGKESGMKIKVLALIHDSPLRGHSGYLKSLHRAKKDWFWHGMKKDIKAYIRGCDTCQRLKHETSKPAGLLQPLAIPPRPWHSISMDFVEGLPTSNKQNVILVIVDRFTKYVHFIFLSHPYTASKVAALFLQHVFKLHGLPSSIVSDRDTVFTSLFWEELFRRQGVDLAMSSSYHPQSDGQTEVVNKSLEHYLRAFATDKPSLWVEWLPLAEYWFNTNYHTSTKLSPFEALYGYLPPRLPPTDALGHLAPQPVKILETRTIKKRRLPAVTKVLVQWEGGDPDDATWELLFKLQEDYPHLVGKVF
uniref:Integrase catalytic domain-containing protein n=1 Tax=Fagus sylvatica TaxID=28930 RepID=A0A2N9H0U4_FAGSY